LRLCGFAFASAFIRALDDNVINCLPPRAPPFSEHPRALQQLVLSFPSFSFPRRWDKMQMGAHPDCVVQPESTSVPDVAFDASVWGAGLEQRQRLPRMLSSTAASRASSRHLLGMCVSTQVCALLSTPGPVTLMERETRVHDGDKLVGCSGGARRALTAQYYQAQGAP
jgi:hypothetical protein